MGRENLIVSITAHHARRLVVDEDQKDISLRTHDFSSFGHGKYNHPMSSIPPNKEQEFATPSGIGASEI
jgi:hypothetical protein